MFYFEFVFLYYFSVITFSECYYDKIKGISKVSNL